MAEDFSDLFSKISKQRQLGKAAARRKIAQAVGGTAATFRGESAPQAFARRAPDYSKQMMSPEQKRLQRLELLKYQEGLDKFYYAEEQKRYLRELEQEMQNRRALLTAETARMREMGASARERARNMRLALSEDIEEDIARAKRISTASDDLNKILRQVVPVDKLKTADERAEDFLKQYNKRNAEGKANLDNKYRQYGGFAKVYKRLAEAEYNKDLEDAQASVRNAVDVLMKTGDRDDIVNGVPRLAIMAKTTPDTLLQALGGNNQQVFSDLRINHLQEQNSLLDNVKRKQIERAEASKSTYGGTGNLGEAQERILAAPKARMRTRAPAPAPTATRAPAPAVAGTPAPEAPTAPQVVEGQEAVVTQQQQKPGFMGIPGVQMPETSQQRVLEMFNIIEEFPEHEPAKQAKMDIMESEDFKKYASRFGPDAPLDKVYKEAVRDARLKAKEGIRKFRQKRAEKRLAESRSRLVKDRKPVVPVTGSDKGIGDTEDVGI